MTVIWIALVIAVCGSTAFFWMREKPLPEEAYSFIRCPRCGQKLRYQTRKAVCSGACPRCLKVCMLPATLHAPAEYLVRPGHVLWGLRRLTTANAAARCSDV